MWRIDSELEFNKVMVQVTQGCLPPPLSYSQVLGCNAGQMKSGAHPTLWTDGLVRDDKLVWSTNGEEVDFSPEQVDCAARLYIEGGRGRFYTV